MITGCCIRVHVRSQPFARIRCSASLRGTVPMGSGGGTRRGARVPKTHLLYSRLRPALLPRVVGLSSGSCLSWCASAFLEVGQALAQPARSRRHASRPWPPVGLSSGGCLTRCASAFLEVGQALAQPARSPRPRPGPHPPVGLSSGGCLSAPFANVDERCVCAIHYYVAGAAVTSVVVGTRFFASAANRRGGLPPRR